MSRRETTKPETSSWMIDCLLEERKERTEVRGQQEPIKKLSHTEPLGVLTRQLGRHDFDGGHPLCCCHGRCMDGLAVSWELGADPAVSIALGSCRMHAVVMGAGERSCGDVGA